MYELAVYRRCVARLESNWRPFSARRLQWMAQHGRGGPAAEKVAENVLQDLFTNVLDWSIADVNNQLRRADIVLAHLGLRRLIVEVKRPGTFNWGRRNIAAALDQARRYADEQKVGQVAISDGSLLYTAEIVSGGLRDRLLVHLDGDEAPRDLWWISADGIYRPRPPDELAAVAQGLDDTGHPQAGDGPTPAPPGDVLLHGRYRLPASCFAYVGDANKPGTWHLPYLLSDGAVDHKRLPKAIQCVFSNYRGARTTSVPEQAIPDVMVRLANAAARVGRLPESGHGGGDAYCMLAEYLDQQDLRARVTS